MKHFEEIHLLHLYSQAFHVPILWALLSSIILFTFLLVLELASAVAQGVKAQAAFQITYPTLLKAATGQCAYFHSNSSPAQHSQIGHPLPSPAKQTKTRKKTLLITQPPPAEFFYDDVHPASGPRSSRWGLKCSNKCSDVTYPPCHHSCDTQQKPCVMLTVSSINPAWDHFK